MRKILLLFAMLLGTVVTWASGGLNLENLSSETAYLLKGKKSGLYMTLINNNAGGIQIKNFTGEDNQLFYIIKSESEDKFNIKNKNGKFLKAVHGWDFNTSDSACDFAITETEEGVYKIARTDRETPNASGGNYVGPNTNATGDGSPLYSNHTDDNDNCEWVFEEVSDLISVTYTYKIDDRQYASEKVAQPKNSAVSVPAMAFLSVVGTEGTIGDSDCEIIVNCKEDLPFILTTDLNSPVWQVVEMHRYGTFRVWDYVENDADVKVTEMSSNKEGVSDDSKLWCFTGNLIDGFKIYNKKAGTTVTLNATSGTAKVGAAAEGNDVWKLKKSSDTNDPAACFTHDGSNCMNQQGGFIKYWSSADNGSTCYFFKPSVKVLEAASAFDGMPLGAVGAYKFTEEQKSAFVAAVNAVVADPDDLNKVKTLSAMIAEAKKLEKITYKDGYYRIYSAQSGLYANKKGLIFEGSTFKWGTISNDNVDAIVKLTTDNEKVVLQNVNSNLYMQDVAGASNPNMTENGHITLTELGAAQYKLVFGNGTMHASGHGNGAGSSGNVIGHVAGFGSASAWYIIPAIELEVEVADEYGSIHLPFDVTLAEGDKAYAVTATSETSATLAEKKDIPAGEGAILAQGTYTLNIAKATSDWKDNKLEGSNVNTYVEGNAYVLAKKDDVIGFYKAELNFAKNGEEPWAKVEENGTHFLNNANKAYLPAPTAATARFISFDFGGETAIDELKGENGNVKTVIYDLSGRRVQGAQKGIFIVNGKKVIK